MVSEVIYCLNFRSLMYLTFKGVHKVNNTCKFITALIPHNTSVTSFWREKQQQQKKTRTIPLLGIRRNYVPRTLSLVLSKVTAETEWKLSEGEWTDINLTRMPFCSDCITCGLKINWKKSLRKRFWHGAFVISRVSGGLIDQCVSS